MSLAKAGRIDISFGSEVNVNSGEDMNMHVFVTFNISFKELPV